MLNTGWTRLKQNAGRVTMSKKVSMLAAAPAPKQSRYVVQENMDGFWFDMIPPVSTYAVAVDAMGMMKQGNYRIKEV